MNNYCVYEHIFPNGKRYIGISNNAEKRWRNGNGYKKQTKMAKAINHYGWDNIVHRIIVDGLSLEQAQRLEREFIDAYDSIENGYNVTIGGDSIRATYLNPHVMEMIRLSNLYDKKYGYVKLDDDIVSICERAKYSKHEAELFNRLDDILQTSDNLYLQWRSPWNKDMEIDAYWCLMLQLLEIECGVRTEVVPYTRWFFGDLFG